MKQICAIATLIASGCSWTPAETDSGALELARIDPASPALPKEPPANTQPAGRAAVVFFHFAGDGTLFTVAQQIGLNIHNAFSGYDKKILLAEETTLGPFDVDQRAQNEADIWDEPSQTALPHHIEELTKQGYITDVFVLAHGSDADYEGDPNAGISTNDGHLSADDIREHLGARATGYTKQTIQMVYQLNCFGAELNDAWLSIGAKAVSGAQWTNYYPNQFNNFVRHWNDNHFFFQALAESDTVSSRTVAQASILAEASATHDNWGSCPFPYTVLSGHSCAKDFFDRRYEWLDQATGKDNMNYSSAKISGGNVTLTKGTRGLVW